LRFRHLVHDPVPFLDGGLLVMVKVCERRIEASFVFVSLGVLADNDFKIAATPTISSLVSTISST
jgi:hypothetical protein